MRTDNQTVAPLPQCASLAHSYCTWNTTTTVTNYIPDVEYMTLLIDHSFASSVGEWWSWWSRCGGSRRHGHAAAVDDRINRRSTLNGWMDHCW